MCDIRYRDTFNLRKRHVKSDSGRDARRERITSKESLNRPPFSSPLSSAEKGKKTGEKAETLPTTYKREN